MGHIRITIEGGGKEPETDYALADALDDHDCHAGPEDGCDCTWLIEKHDAQTNKH